MTLQNRTFRLPVNYRRFENLTVYTTSCAVRQTHGPCKQVSDLISYVNENATHRTVKSADSICL
jgi:hypothetical protein